MQAVMMFLLGILVLTVDVILAASPTLPAADDEDNHEYYLVIRVDPGDFSEFAVDMEDATELFGDKDSEAGTTRFLTESQFITTRSLYPHCIARLCCIEISVLIGTKGRKSSRFSVFWTKMLGSSI